MKICKTCLMLLILASAAFSAALSVRHLLLLANWEKAERKTAIVVGSATEYHPAEHRRELIEAHDEWLRLSRAFPANAELAYLAGRLALIEAFSAAELTEKLRAICEGLSLFQQAAVFSPASPRYQIAWADVAAQISKPERSCSSSGISFSEDTLGIEGRLQHALGLAPFSGVDAYLAAIVYVAVGKKIAALSLLRDSSEVNPVFTQLQREYVYRLVSSQDELEAALPRKFPEVVSWVNHFFLLRPRDYSAWRTTFESAVERSIDELLERLSAKRLDPVFFANYLKQVSMLPPVFTSDQLRRRLDDLLANIYAVDGFADWSDFLRQRSQLARVPVLKSSPVDDKQPKTTMLFAWHREDSLEPADLDVLGRTVGIFIPRGFNVRYLVLENAAGGEKLSDDLVELLTSEDNLRFYPYSSKVHPRSLLIDGRQRLIFGFTSDEAFRYLKIRYRGPGHEASFRNSLQNLVQAYGEKISDVN